MWHLGEIVIGTQNVSSKKIWTTMSSAEIPPSCSGYFETGSTRLTHRFLSLPSANRHHISIKAYHIIKQCANFRLVISSAPDPFPLVTGNPGVMISGPHGQITCELLAFEKNIVIWLRKIPYYWMPWSSITFFTYNTRSKFLIWSYSIPIVSEMLSVPLRNFFNDWIQCISNRSAKLWLSPNCLVLVTIFHSTRVWCILCLSNGNVILTLWGLIYDKLLKLLVRLVT